MYTRVYHRTMDAIIKTDRFVSSCGGTRSGKTFALLQAFFELAIQDEVPTLTSVVSETFPHLKRGAIRDFPIAIGENYDPQCWNKSESIYTLPNGSQIEFFSADAPSKVHGPARDRLFLNEAQNIPFEIARQLFIRTKGLIAMDYNPTASFWCNERYEPREDCVTIHSTYKDNDLLSDEQMREIESNKNDSNWWKVYGLGEFGTLEGLIYKFTTIDVMPDSTSGLHESWGIDFGFSSDPTAIVRVMADTGKKIAYVDEIAYEKGMTNHHIASRLNMRKILPSVNIWADAAEPKSIAEIIEDTGLKIQACNKGAPTTQNKLRWQLQWMQGWQINVTKRSINLIKELRNYTWAKDRDGNLTGQPIDEWNHACDAMRYALFSELAGRETSGRYVLTFNS